jgi:hypothetical protein
MLFPASGHPVDATVVSAGALAMLAIDALQAPSTGRSQRLRYVICVYW